MFSLCRKKHLNIGEPGMGSFSSEVDCLYLTDQLSRAPCFQGLDVLAFWVEGCPDRQSSILPRSPFVMRGIKLIARVYCHPRPLSSGCHSFLASPDQSCKDGLPSTPPYLFSQVRSSTGYGGGGYLTHGVPHSSKTKHLLLVCAETPICPLGVTFYHFN